MSHISNEKFEFLKNKVAECLKSRGYTELDERLPSYGSLKAAMLALAKAYAKHSWAVQELGEAEVMLEVAKKDASAPLNLISKESLTRYSDKVDDALWIERQRLAIYKAALKQYELHMGKYVQEKDQLAEIAKITPEACFAAVGLDPHNLCEHGIPGYACMPCSH